MTSSPLAKKFSMKELLKYTLPSIIMMVFMSTYSIIDGVFVSTYVGENALAAVNLVMPLLGVVLAVGLMFATGGNAVIAKLLGQGKAKQAREFLTLIYIIGGVLGTVLTMVVFIFPDDLLNMLNVSDNLYTLARDYMLSLAPFLLPVFFMVFIQSFMITAGHPTFGLVLSLAGGITNIVLDYIFISPDLMNMGIVGAGLATGIGNALPGLLGFIYFLCNRKCILHFVKPKVDFRTLMQSVFNGSSELVGSLATSITTMLFNLILMRMVGDIGVASISVILYIQMFQNAIYIGYTLGVSPIIAFKYGEENYFELREVIRRSLQIILVASISVILITLVFSNQAVAIFIEKESATFEMARNGLLYFLPAYLFMGFNIFFSAMFTSFSNGKVSAIISVLRSLVFIIIALLFLPNLFGLNGVWLAVPIAEFLALIVSFYFYKKNKCFYKY